MDPRIRSAVARIEVRSGDEVLSRGTGTLVGDGIVLTALHVVANRFTNPPELLPGEVVLTFPSGSCEARIQITHLDPRGDWALLACEPPEGAEPAPLSESVQAGEPFETFGFPDAQPRDGMVQTGSVKDVGARLEGVPVLQLFSQEASAGDGAPVKGLSGGPVFVEGALVGHLRFALMREGRTVAGTLYACPVTSVLEAAAGLFALPDPCRGLPGLPPQPLPASPYRYLERFTAREAEVFFGRNREIRAVYERLTEEDAAPLLLLYGQSGVGKSSFLDAGLLPRLQWSHEVVYLRREEERGLLEQLRGALLDRCDTSDANPDLPLIDLWGRVEANRNQPLIVILDQIEEVFTRPVLERPDELRRFFRALGEAFADPACWPRGCLVLAFRKEWFPEIQKQVESRGIEYGKVFLEGLDREAVLEVVEGIRATKRLKERYGVELEQGLPALIADDLLQDPGSPVAPSLQILLTRLWQRAVQEERSRPRFGSDLYRDLVRQGVEIGDFLDLQLDRLAERDPDAYRSGLALDILAFHTTPLLTARERSREELLEHYHQDERRIDRLVQELKDLYLLVESARDRDEVPSNRLAHDTLAAVVRNRVDDSDRPGQRARRILENRAVEWEEGKEGAVLDRSDLSIVEGGLPAMRVPSPDEARLLEASREAERRRRRRRNSLRAAGITAIVVIVAAAGWALSEKRQAEHEKLLAELSHTTDEVGVQLMTEPVRGLALAIEAAGRSLEELDEVLPALQGSLQKAMEEVWEMNLLDHGAPATAVAFDPSGEIVASGGEEGGIRLWNRRTGLPLRDLAGHDGRVTDLAFFPTGDLLASSGEDGVVHVWSLVDGGSRADLHPTDLRPLTALAIFGEGRGLAAGDESGSLWLWRRSGEEGWGPPQRREAHDDIIYDLATAAGEAAGWLASASEDGRVLLNHLEKPGESRPLWANGVLAHEGPVYAVDMSPGGIVVTGGADDSVRWWGLDGSPHGHPFRMHTDSVKALALDDDGDEVFSAGGDELVYVSDPDGRALTAPFRGIDGSITRMAADFERGFLAVASADGTVRLADQMFSQIGHAHPVSEPRALGWQPESRGWIALTPTRILMLEERGMAFAPSDHQRHEELPGDVCALASVPMCAVCGTSDGAFTHWVSGEREVRGLGERRQGDEATATAISEDGRWIATASLQTGVRIWDASKDELLRVVLRGGRTRVDALAFTRDATVLAAGTVDGTVLRWNLDGSPAGATLEGDGVPATAMVWSQDGTRLLVGNAQGYLILWSFGEHKNDFQFKAHNGAVRALAFHAGENRIISAGADRTVRLWTEDGQSLAIFRGHRRPVVALASHAGAPTLASAGLDDTVRLWRADWQEWLAVGCHRLHAHPIFRDPPDRIAARAKQICATRGDRRITPLPTTDAATARAASAAGDPAAR